MAKFILQRPIGVLPVKLPNSHLIPHDSNPVEQSVEAGGVVGPEQASVLQLTDDATKMVASHHDVGVVAHVHLAPP